MTMVSERQIARAVGDFAAAGIRVEGSAAAALAAFRELETPGVGMQPRTSPRQATAHVDDQTRGDPRRDVRQDHAQQD